MLLGGDFTKTGQNKNVPGRMTFVLQGGTLEVTNSVRFYTAETAYNEAKGFYDQVYAEMPAAASATVDVKVASSIDMTLFTYGAGASLTKKGPGKMTVGTLPPALSVETGTVAFSTALTGLSGVTLSDGVTVEFDAKNNALASIANADKLTFTIGAGFGDGDTIVASADTTLLDTIYLNFEMPDYLKDEYKLRVLDGALKLYRSIAVEVCVRDLTLYVGDAVTNAGYVIISKRTGEIVTTDDIHGTPTYEYEYEQGAEAGTYEIAMSGLWSENYDITYRFATMTVVPADERKVFYWNGGQAFCDFGAISNWTMDAEHEIEATRLPGRNDLIAHRTEQYGTAERASDYHIGKWDLLGGAQSFYGYTTGTVFKTWVNWWVDLTNGTLTVRNPTVFAGAASIEEKDALTFGHLYHIWNGATLHYPASTFSKQKLSNAGLTEYWLIHAGGTVRAECGLMFGSPSYSYYGGCEVKAGGTLIFDPSILRVSANNAMGLQFVNNGTMICPHGLVWSETGYTSSTKCASGRDEMLFIQKAGRMTLGGDIMRTNNAWAANVTMPSRLELILTGGTLEISNTVRVVTSEDSYKKHVEKWGEEVGGAYRKQAFASLADNADVTIDLTDGSFLDMTEFTYGTSAKLTTTGTGRLHFGAELPSALTVDGGVIDFADPAATTTASTVKLESGTIGAFPLRVWKDGSDNVVNDTLDLTDDLEGLFTIRPTAHGFRFALGDTLRLGAYAATRALPSDDFAHPGWTFCRVADDADALYLRYTGRGSMMLIK